MESLKVKGEETEQQTSMGTFLPPSVDKARLVSGESYSHFSAIPKVIADDISTECVLGVDEAGRGPVLGPMVYALFYLPLRSHSTLLSDESHHFADSKTLSPEARSSLMQALCTPDNPLYQACGWATKAISARDISSGMLGPHVAYNLNAQAQDATVELIKAVFDMGINIKEIYIDTIGRPETYQRKLENIFPTINITVAKKADALYPCVSAASVCAKVTRDSALEVCYENLENKSMGAVHVKATVNEGKHGVSDGWGSGYPSDDRCTTWLKRNKDALFGWGNECRFSWGTAKDILERKPSVGPKKSISVEWLDASEDSSENMQVTEFFTATRGGPEKTELSNWYGIQVGDEAFL